MRVLSKFAGAAWGVKEHSALGSTGKCLWQKTVLAHNVVPGNLRQSMIIH